MIKKTIKYKGMFIDITYSYTIEKRMDGVRTSRIAILSIDGTSIPYPYTYQWEERFGEPRRDIVEQTKIALDNYFDQVEKSKIVNSIEIEFEEWDGVILESNKKVIWTYFRNAFSIGGYGNIPTGCEVEVGDAHDLGSGYFGYEIILPNGNTIIAEKESGAIVGDSLLTVMYDIKNAGEEVMEKQVTDAINESLNVSIISEDEFWKVYNKCM